ncbi:MAG: NAD(P)H-dependent oxidoreductase [Pseudonocardia sp.]|nr:NAD(P)H-dependent oxidoreductase [Pseudonocardia sp.]
MTLQVALVVGNPKPESRTRRIAQGFVDALVAGIPHETIVVDLAEYAGRVHSWPDEELDGLNAAVAASQVVVFASPTYKATYTGLLKAFLDRYPSDGLAGVIAVPLLTGGGPRHAMGPTFTLAPLLAELGAVVPGRGLYFDMAEMDRMDEVVAAMAAGCRETLARLGQVGAQVPGEPVASGR